MSWGVRQVTHHHLTTSGCNTFTFASPFFCRPSGRYVFDSRILRNQLRIILIRCVRRGFSPPSGRLSLSISLSDVAKNKLGDPKGRPLIAAEWSGLNGQRLC